MPGEHRQSTSLADDGDGFLTNGRVVTPLGIASSHDPQLAERLVQQWAAPPVDPSPHDVVEEHHRPGGGSDVGSRVPPARSRRNPQDQVRKGQVRQQLPVPQKQMQPLNVDGIQIGLFTKHIVQGWHSLERSPATCGSSASPAQMVADPLRMTPRKMRRATDRAEIPGLSSRWIPASAALARARDSALVSDQARVRSLGARSDVLLSSTEVVRALSTAYRS